jgi:hypothetical protein
LAANMIAGAHGPSVRYPERVDAEGETSVRLKKAYDRLCSPPLSDADFVVSDVSFHFKRRFTEYSGDISGRMLGALNQAGPIIGRNTPMIDVLIAAFRKYQKPDGHFGADQDLDRKVDQSRDMPILWGNGRLLLALAERYRSAPDAELLAMARRLGDYAISTRKYYGKKENFEHVGGVAASGYTTCYPSLIDGLAALAEASGDERFYEEARFIARLSLLDREFLKHHSHGRLTAYRGMLDIDRCAGKREFLDAVRSGYKTIMDEFLMPTGGVEEYFDRAYSRDEGCSEGDWLRVSFLLWQATGDTTYLDAAEHILRNHILASQFPNGGFGHRDFDTLKDGRETYPFGGISNRGSESYWCCAMHCTQALADTARWGVVATGDKVLITWLGEVRATFEPKADSPPLTVTTERTGPDTWKVSLDSTSKPEIRLALRVPGWAKEITVEGKRHIPEGGWVTITPKWSGPMVLNVSLPADIRLAGVFKPQIEAGKPVRIFAGPDLYCLPDAQVANGLVPATAVPTVVVAVQHPVGDEIPVIIAGQSGKTQRAKLLAMSHRPPGGARYLFRVRRVDAEEFDKLAAAAAPMPRPGTALELEFGCDGECQVFLNGERTHEHAGTDESPQVEVYSHRQGNVVAVVARGRSQRPVLIGAIRVGGRTLLTRLEDWTVVPVSEKVPADWLTDPLKGSDQAVKLLDLGGFGAAPWNHVPADYAGSAARWISPETTNKSADQRWLFRCRFTVR